MIPRETSPVRWWYPPVIAILVFAALAVAGTKDYEDAIRQADHYCDMVKQGAWPDFKGLHEKGECDER